MLIFTDVRVDDLAAQGKSFNWNRPSCPCGVGKVWGHGYVTRFLAALVVAIWVKRFRCPSCRRVFTMLPAGLCRRYQTPGAEIASALTARLAHRSWPPGILRQRGGHWLRKFLARCRLSHPEDEPLAVLRRLAADGIHFLD